MTKFPTEEMAQAMAKAAQEAEEGGWTYTVIALGPKRFQVAIRDEDGILLGYL